jgi:hypothetical protein
MSLNRRSAGVRETHLTFEGWVIVGRAMRLSTSAAAPR